MGNDDTTTSITIQLTVTSEQGAPRVPLMVETNVTPTQLRQNAAKATKIPLNTIKLIYRGRLITDSDDKQAVSEFKLEEGSVLHCMGKPLKDDDHGVATDSAFATNAATLPTFSVPPAAAAATIFGSTDGGDPLTAALQKIRAQNSHTVYQTAVRTLDTVLQNIIQNPMEEKYRKLKKQNAAFAKRLGNVGHDALLACGFVLENASDEQMYVLNASAEAWPALLETKSKVSQAVMQAETFANTAPAVSGSGFPTFLPTAAGIPDMGSMHGMGFPGGTTPEMQRMAAQMMSNPQQLQAMLQDPMVQNMIRNDPRLANNPMLAHAMQELSNNPALAAQLGQMLSNPDLMQERMQQMAPFQQMMLNSGNSNPGHGAAPTNNANSGENTGTNDADLTEEEMIAEAIRRSLQDNNDSNGSAGGSS